MSKRSTATLARKLRAEEDAYATTLRRDLRELIAFIEAEARRSPPTSPVPDLLLAGLREMMTRSFTQGVLLLRTFTVEVGTAVTRDLRGVAANSGTDLTDVIRDWEPFGWEAGAMEWWEGFCTGVVTRAWVEVRRQAGLVRIYEDDLMVRLFSPGPARLPGRRGMGVYPALISVFVGGIINPAYSMVNSQKQAAYRQALVLANG